MFSYRSREAASAALPAMERLPSIGEALEAFYEHLLLRDRSPATVRTYKSLLQGLQALPLTKHDCGRLLLSKRAPGSRLTTYGALRSFVAFLRDEGWQPDDPMAHIPLPKVPVPNRRRPSSEECRTVFAAARDDNTRLLLLLLGLGLRCIEVSRLKRSDIRGDVAMIKGKGNRYRKVVLPVEILALLSDRERVIALQPHSIYTKVKRLGVEAGLPWLSPHRFRHAWATEWMRQTQDMETLRTLGGWSETSIMPRYYSKAALEEAAIEKSRHVDLHLFSE
jgi:integrase